MPKKKSSKVGLPALECCTGCAACVDSCTVTAIKMMPDECGFLYPVLNHDRCVECQACLQACPVNSTAIEGGDFYAYLAWSPMRHASSSGGIFPTLAQKAIEKGETVIAVAWKDIAHLHFIEVDTPEKLAQCLGSKYLQCNAEGVYRRVGELLNAGKHVLFFGMPCQAAAMRHRFINHSNLSIVDFACHGVPSEQMWGDYLKEAHADWQQIKKVDFRDKRHGWRADTLSASMQDGSWQVWPYENNAYEQAFHTNLSLRTSCYDCPFAEPPHWSDLTLADFWGVDQLSDEPLAGEGANLLLVNTAKGRSIVEEIKSRLVCFEEVNAEKAIAPNRFKKKIEMAHGRNEFLKKYPKLGFCESVNQSLHGKRDIGVIGCWSIENHGSNMSYFALYHFLREKGYSVLMIERPADSLWPPVGQPLGFNTQVYEPEDLSPVYLNKFEMRVLNTQCDTFVLGSDQLLYHDLYRSFSRFIGMQYIYDNKKKIAYATSLGRDSFEGDEQMRAELSFYLKRYDAISVREKYGKEVLEREFDVKSEPVLDPVFLCDRKAYHKLADSVTDLPNEPFVAAYVLDPSGQLEDVLWAVGQQEGKPVIVITDVARSKESIRQSWSFPTRVARSNEEWLAIIRKCELFITDSFHGSCFAIMFHKQFVAIGNKRRGITRFTSLFDQLGLSDRLVMDVRSISNVLDAKPIDYQKVDAFLEIESERSERWLLTQLEKPKKASLSTYDMINMRIDIECIGQRQTVEQQMLWCQNMQHSLDALEKEVYQQGSVLEANMPWLTNIQHSLDALEKEVYQQGGALEGNMPWLTNIQHSLDVLEKEVCLQSSTLETIKIWLTNMQHSLDVLETEIMQFHGWHPLSKLKKVDLESKRQFGGLKKETLRVHLNRIRRKIIEFLKKTSK